MIIRIIEPSLCLESIAHVALRTTVIQFVALPAFLLLLGTPNQELCAESSLPDSAEAPASSEEGLWYWGFQIGFPSALGIRLNSFLQKAPDGMPLGYVTVSTGISYGIYGSLTISGRLGKGRIYPTAGLFYNHFLVFPAKRNGIFLLMAGLQVGRFNRSTLNEITFGVLVEPNDDGLVWMPIVTVSWTKPL